MKIKICLFVGFWLTVIAGGQDLNNIEYLCCDWGPAMTLPGKTNATPQFSETEEEIYFLKQVRFFTRQKTFFKDMFSGRDHEDVGNGLSIWLCKMKADGSGKTEIKELWKNPAYPIDTQVQSTWMSVNVMTRTIAISIFYAGSDLMGLWTVKLDGSELKHIINPSLIEGHLQAVNRPCWTPDGQWIVFGESLRGATRGRIAKCDKDGQRKVYLTAGPTDSQPCLSPDGTKVAYVVISTTKGGLWIMNADGSDAHLLPNPGDKKRNSHSGIYPAWSPDGKRIFAVGVWVLNAETGGMEPSRSPRLISSDGIVLEEHSSVVMPHWGRFGLLCGGWGGGITVVDSNFENQRIIALSSKEKK
jgi:hypothetical protein